MIQKTFVKEVSFKRKDMIDFLKNHSRYNTMNSWNNSTSYAHNVKIYNVIPKEYKDVAYNIMEQGDVYEAINDILSEFRKEHNYEYQITFNGRSNGYLVLIHGGYTMRKYFPDFSPNDPDEKRDYSDYYGKWYSHKEAKEMGTAYKEYKSIYTTPGLNIDMNEDFLEWSNNELIDRVKLVKQFDRVCEQCLEIFINYCKNYKVVEKEILVSKKILQLERNQK